MFDQRSDQQSQLAINPKEILWRISRHDFVPLKASSYTLNLRVQCNMNKAKTWSHSISPAVSNLAFSVRTLSRKLLPFSVCSRLHSRFVKGHRAPPPVSRPEVELNPSNDVRINEFFQGSSKGQGFEGIKIWLWNVFFQLNCFRLNGTLLTWHPPLI